VFPYIKLWTREHKSHKPLPALNKRSYEELKRAVATIKSKSRNLHRHARLDRAELAACRVFIFNLNHLIIGDAKIIRNKFKISAEKEAAIAASCGFSLDFNQPMQMPIIKWSANTILS
jgi:hypothetical protein